MNPENGARGVLFAVLCGVVVLAAVGTVGIVAAESEPGVTAIEPGVAAAVDAGVADETQDMWAGVEVETDDPIDIVINIDDLVSDETGGDSDIDLDDAEVLVDGNLDPSAEVVERDGSYQIEIHAEEHVGPGWVEFELWLSGIDTSEATPDDAGVTYTVEAQQDGADGDFDTFESEKSAETPPFELTPPDAFFAVELLEADDSVPEGEPVQAVVEVENTGGVEDTQTVSLDIYGENYRSDHEVDTEEVTLDAGGSEIVALEWETEEGDAGKYEAVVESEDDTDWTVVEVGERGFHVTIEETNDPIIEGETLEVTITIENTDDVVDTQTVSIEIAEQIDEEDDPDRISEPIRSLDKEDDEGLDLVKAVELTLDAGESETIDFTWGTTGGDAGEYRVTVHSEDDSDDTPVTIEAVTVDADPEELYAGGSGTTDNPYHIENWSHLANISSFPDRAFILKNDLNKNSPGYSDVVTDQEDGFEPLGVRNDEFTGTFDGDGHVIENLVIATRDESYVGLFGIIGEDALVENVGIEGADVTGYRAVGALVGHNWGGEVRNSYATGTVTIVGGVWEDILSVGGLIGINQGEVSESHSTADVVDAGSDDELAMGGLVGANFVGSNISQSYATGDVIASDNTDENVYMGGLLGGGVGDVTKSYATGDVIGGDGDGDLIAGGLVGWNVEEGDFQGEVSESYATGEVSGDGRLGGLVGGNQGEIVESSATGTVTSSNVTNPRGVGQEVGGLVGFNGGDVIESSAKGTVTGGDVAEGDQFVGGFVGRNGGQFDGMGNSLEGTVVGSSATGNVTGGNVSDGGQGIGGLVGGNTDHGKVIESSATGTVTGGDGDGSQFVAGLAGLNEGEVVESSATGDVVGGHDVKGDQAVGGLVGGNGPGSTIRESFATGNVTGGSSGGDIQGTGGLVGASVGEVHESYATGDVTGDGNVGGLVGWNVQGEVSESYATGEVTGDGPLGGLIGHNDDGEVSTSYWDIETTGQGEDDGIGEGDGDATGLKTLAMKGENATENMAFVESDTWTVITGDAISYPFLVNNPQDPAPGLEEEKQLFAGGNGTAENPFEIANWTHLDNVREHLDADFIVVADLNESSEDYDEHVGTPEGGFEPIGEDDNPFTGHFDGNGHVIENLTIDRPEEQNVSLFGIATRASIENVTLESVDITGDSNVGGLVAEARTQDDIPTEVKQSSVTGTVTGTERVGGLVGFTSGKIVDSVAAVDVTNSTAGSEKMGGLVGLSMGTVERSEATGDVTGDKYVGGLIGDNGGIAGGGVVSNSSATGDVTGNEQVGGLVGFHSHSFVWAESLVTTSYATGDVEGSEEVGGLVGRMTSGEIAQSYATGAVTGESMVGGVLGTNDGGSIHKSYATGAVDGNATVGGLVGINEEGEIRESYAAGAVDGNSTVGGLVGANTEDATVETSYWDADTTGQNSSAYLGDEYGLTTVEMTGLNATETMDFEFPVSLDSSSTWYVTDSYPVLEWEGTNPFFEVNITETSSPVKAGETLTVTATVRNWAADGTQTVTLTDTDFAGDQQDEINVTLASGESNESLVLDWVTDGDDVGAGTVTAASENDADTAEVTVEAISDLSNLSIAGEDEPTITQGDNESVSVDVTNVDNQENQFDVTLEIGTDTETQPTDDLDPGANETVVFENVTGDLDPGEYDVTVSTTDDVITRNLTVQAPAESALSNLRVAGESTDATITEGDDESISVDVENVGDQDGQFEVLLELGEQTTNMTVEVTSGESQTATFEGVTGDLESGDYVVTASTVDDELAGDLTVEEDETEAEPDPTPPPTDDSDDDETDADETEEEEGDEDETDEEETDETETDDDEADEADAGDDETDETETDDGETDEAEADEDETEETEQDDDSEETETDDESVEVEEVEDDSAIPEVLGGTSAFIALVLLLLVVAALAAVYKFQVDSDE